MLKPLLARNLTAPRIRHGFFTREGGVSEGIYAGLNCGLGSGDDPARVIENRRRVAAHLEADHDGVATLYQVHGSLALTIDRPQDRTNLPKADAVVSRTPGLAIGVLTADCTPVLFADPDAGVVGAAHAGWRGAVGGILEATIHEMERAGAHRENIYAAIGPTISAAVYEVGPDFRADVTKLDPASERFFVTPASKTRPHFDLPGYVASRLSGAGLTNIEVCTPCTYQDESLLFSYRRSQMLREGDYGRQISAIVVA